MQRQYSGYTRVQGESVPSLGLGTFQLRGAEAVRAVAHALDVGYRHLDTAAMYGNESEVGRGLTESSVDREDVFVTTKVWRDSLRASAVRESAESSLRKLRLDYLDLLLIHWPNPEVPLEETLSEMMRLADDGKTRRIGVSNFPPDWFKEAMGLAPIFCNQVEYHPLLGQAELTELARENDILITAYSPLAQGALIKDRRLTKIGQKYGKTPSQVVLRWLIQQDHVVAIPRSSNVDHRAANFDIWDFALDGDDMRTISGMDRQKRFVRPSWAI